MTALFQSLRRSIHLWSLVVGVGAGLGAIGFEYLSSLVVHLALHGLAGYQPGGPRGELVLFQSSAGHEPTAWLLLVVPALGCWLACLLCRWFAPEASGHGTDAAIDAYHRHNGQIRARVPLLKAVTSALTLGTGGSAGREGPIAQIGAGIGAALGRGLGLGPRSTRILLAAGMAGGVGAIFRAPFAGALFAAEILYRDADLEAEVVMPGFLASAAAYCVFCGWHGEFGTLFALGPGFVFTDLRELLPYTALALLLVPMIAFYTRFFYASERWFQRLPLPRTLVAALGGLACGGLAVAAWTLTGEQHALSIAGGGYGILQSTLDGEILGWAGARLLFLVAAVKVVATACTIAAGGSGGVFGPSMVIGGCVGGAVGLVGGELGLVTNPATFAVVGMCGFFAGAAKTPISTIVMVTEMTGSYQLLLPAMWVCGCTFLCSRPFALYRKQVANRAESPAHAGEYQVALLERMTVADVFEPGGLAPVPIATPLGRIVQLLVDSREDYFHVVDDHGRFVGVFSANDVRQFTFDREVYDLTIAGDVMTQQPVTVHPGDDLHTALAKFDQVRLDELPVVATEDPQRLLGRLRRRALNRAYTRRLAELRDLQRKEH